MSPKTKESYGDAKNEAEAPLQVTFRRLMRVAFIHDHARLGAHLSVSSDICKIVETPNLRKRHLSMCERIPDPNFVKRL